MTAEQYQTLAAHHGQVLAFTGHRPDKVAQFENSIRIHMFAAIMVMRPSEVISGMAVGVDTWAAGTPEAWADCGGQENVQRVRVVQSATGEVTYEYMFKLPPSLVKERKEKAEREAKKAAVLAKLEELRSDPKAMEKFTSDVAMAVLGRSLVIGMLKKMLASSKKPANKKPANKKPVRKVPPKKVDPYEAALRQDRHNRIEAAKKAAEEFRAKQKMAS